MAKKAKVKPKVRKAASRKPATTSAKKKVSKKKPSPLKKTAKKKAAKKKLLKKRVVKKPAKKKAAKNVINEAIPTKTIMVEPGPPPGSIPPVEEPAHSEKAIGTVTHYYSHLNVAVIQLYNGTITTGDTIRVSGHSTDFTQQVESMEYEHQHVDQATAGQCVGLMVKDHAREHDIVYLVK